MAPFEFMTIEKPRYRYRSYKHFKDTRFVHPAFSLAPSPVAWMKKGPDGVPEKSHEYGIGFRPELETLPDGMSSLPWVQERENQLALLDTFFSAVVPHESLIFVYARQIPLTEDPRPVIIGIGHALRVDEHVEQEYRGASVRSLRAVLWKRNVHHSIRPDRFEDGLLLPYHELITRFGEDESNHIDSRLLHVPDEVKSGFLGTAEHITHNQAAILLATCSGLLNAYEQHRVSGDWPRARQWLNSQLNTVWKMRGQFPGFGSALTALGLVNGTLIAYAIGDIVLKTSADPWSVLERAFSDPRILPPELARSIDPQIVTRWSTLAAPRRQLLQLLARFELSAAQTKRWFDAEERNKAGIVVSDHEILRNPYRCFEIERRGSNAFPISVQKIDQGMFSDPVVTPTSVPFDAPTLTAALDPRRVRAFCIATLAAEAAVGGHTLLPEVRLLYLLQRANLRIDMLVEETLEPHIHKVRLADGTPAWQLDELTRARQIITNCIEKRLTLQSYAREENWEQLIDNVLPPLTSPDEAEQQARKEKSEALRALFQNPLSVLVGPAGSGKTSLLKALLSMLPSRVLLLAPTGKARVELQKRAGQEASTIAQFLIKSGRYRPATGSYEVVGPKGRLSLFETVIIDESSMVTEEQFAAILDALHMTTLRRLILVGDPWQLPPIGPGRPFVDLLKFLKTPKPGYRASDALVELSTVRRQSDPKVADAVALARCFRSDARSETFDEILGRIANGKARGVRAVEWTDEQDLYAKLSEQIRGLTRWSAKSTYGGDDPETCFEVSLGGRRQDGAVYFSACDETSPGSAASVDHWQVLSPVRFREGGIFGLNRWIQKTFRARTANLAVADQYYKRKIYKPLGPEGILYGDKVLSTTNREREDVSPSHRAPSYLANGELGVVVGQFKGRQCSYPAKVEVEFASQPGARFGFDDQSFSGSDQDPLELAYAVTVHKAQGSDFEVTIVVIPTASRLLSRELLYTALTRNRSYLVLLHKGELRLLRSRISPQFSDAARRITNLFRSPHLVNDGPRILDLDPIHKTIRGESVNSKSEVIIANVLHSLNIDYRYEQPFRGEDGKVKYPDFTFRESVSGKLIFLEHLGMLGDPGYRADWEDKLSWYRLHGVRPFEEGGGEVATLLTTTEEHGINSQEISNKLRAALGHLGS